MTVQYGIPLGGSGMYLKDGKIEFGVPLGNSGLYIPLTSKSPSKKPSYSSDRSTKTDEKITGVRVEILKTDNYPKGMDSGDYAMEDFCRHLERSAKREKEWEKPEYSDYASAGI